MLEYDRIDVSEGINNDKCDKSCECMICHHLHFLRMNFRFQAKVCDDCDDVNREYKRTPMPKCDFNKVACFATLLKSHFDTGVLVQISWIFSEHLFLRTPLGGCFCLFQPKFLAVLYKTYVGILMIPNSFFIWGNIKDFQIKYRANYFMVAVLMQRRMCYRVD